MKRTLTTLATLLLSPLVADAALPVVSNVSSSQRPGTKLVDIRYDVADADGDLLKIRVEISSDGGVNYSVPAFSLSGAIGDAVVPGTGKMIVWNAEIDWDGEYSQDMRIKVIASDAKGLPGLKWGNEVPPGGFLMGQDGGAEGGGPSRHVNVPWSFWLSKYEITNAQYAEYLNIATAAGEVYRFGTTGMRAVGGAYPGIPADSTLLDLGNSYDIRWSVNKLAPITGREDSPVSVTWFGALAFALHYGYDLPTTAEWEKGARGPDHDDEDEHLIYPWGNTIHGGQANYGNSGDPYGSGGIYFQGKAPVGYFNGSQTPFGPNMNNAYGLYDVIGNVAEWTRTAPTSIETYPQEETLAFPANEYNDSSSNRIHRGGHSESSPSESHRIYSQTQRAKSAVSFWEPIGFRVIRRDS